MLVLDECVVELQTANRNIGKAYVGKRVNQNGLYHKSTKYNLLLAILSEMARVQDGHRREIWTGEGTTGERMVNFVQMIIDDIGPGTDQCLIALLWIIYGAYVT